jgi:hypothetical protein
VQDVESGVQIGVRGETAANKPMPFPNTNFPTARTSWRVSEGADGEGFTVAEAKGREDVAEALEGVEGFPQFFVPIQQYRDCSFSRLHLGHRSANFNSKGGERGHSSVA